MESRGAAFQDEEKALLLIASLLHDIGHGPFSHLFETFCKNELEIEFKHENWTKQIIKEDEEINKVIRGINVDYPQRLVELFDGIITPHYLTAIISSQLDVDRFDYLLRDTYMTGARYGNFDHEWILKHLSIEDIPNKSIVKVPDDKWPTIKTIVIDGKKGLSALEQHILGRHYMYKHVYLHKTIRAAEAMLRLIMKRAAHLINEGEKVGNSAFRKLAFGTTPTVEDYMLLNNFAVLAWIEEWAVTAKDELLRGLCDSFVRRDLFGVYELPYSGKAYADEREHVKEILGSSFEYSFIEDETTDVAFKDYFYYLQNDRDPQEIWYLDKEGNPQPLSGYEGVIMAAKDSLTYDTAYWHIPKKAIEELKRRVSGKKEG